MFRSKRFSIAIALALVCLVAPNDAKAQLSSDHMVIKAALAPLSINGLLTEWSNADSVVVRAYDYKNGRLDSAVVWALWDYEKLYLAFSVRDDRLWVHATDNNQEVWDDDCAEFYISVNPAKAPLNYFGPCEFQFMVNLNNTLATINGIGDTSVKINGVNRDMAWHADLLSGVHYSGTLNNNNDIDSGFTVEMAIFWSEVGCSPHTGDTLLADFCVEDRDGPAPDTLTWYDWRMLGISFCQPSRWGKIVLAGNPPASAATSMSHRKTGAASALLVLGTLFSLSVASLWVILRRKKRAIRQPQIPGNSTMPPTRNEEILRQLLSILETEYANEISTAEMAGRLCISERHLQRIIKDETEKNYRDLLNNARLEAARKLLETTDLTASQICFQVGFNTFSHFRRMFKEQTGTTAPEYRKRLRENTAPSDSQE